MNAVSWEPGLPVRVTTFSDGVGDFGWNFSMPTWLKYIISWEVTEGFVEEKQHTTLHVKEKIIDWGGKEEFYWGGCTLIGTNTEIPCIFRASCEDRNGSVHKIDTEI